MVVGTLKVDMYLYDNRSLKGKRKIVKSIVDRVKHKYNVSIAEVGANDKWQKIEIGVSAVGNDRRHINSSLNNVLSFIDSLFLAEIVNSRIDIINYSETTPQADEWK